MRTLGANAPVLNIPIAHIEPSASNPRKTFPRAELDEMAVTIRDRYDRLLEDYLRADRSTTYQGWLDHGPKGEWDELVAALSDDAIWDRLVDTYERRNHAHAE